MNKRKMYCSRWSEEETFALIEARSSFDDEFKKKTSQYNVIWKMIQSTRIEIENRQPQECSKKWNNLMDTFKKMKDPKTGTAPASINSSNWPYFQKINDLMGAKHNISPPDILDSINDTAIEEADLTPCDPLYTEFEFLLDESSASTEQQSVSTTNAGNSGPSPPKKKKQSFVEYVKERDAKMLRSMDKSNKIIKKVVHKYFSDVDLSSSESD